MSLHLFEPVFATAAASKLPYAAPLTIVYQCICFATKLPQN